LAARVEAHDTVASLAISLLILVLHLEVGIFVALKLLSLTFYHDSFFDVNQIGNPCRLDRQGLLSLLILLCLSFLRLFNLFIYLGSVFDLIIVLIGSRGYFGLVFGLGIMVLILTQVGRTLAESHISKDVCLKALIVHLVNLLFTGLVPELVEQLIIVLLPQSRLNDSVQVLLAKNSLHAFAIGAHLNVDELLSGL